LGQVDLRNHELNNADESTDALEARDLTTLGGFHRQNNAVVGQNSGGRVM
jgi:hypothetical protein